MAQTGALYEDLGADYYTRIQPIRTTGRAIRQVQELVYTVCLDPPELPSGNLRVSWAVFST